MGVEYSSLGHSASRNLRLLLAQAIEHVLLRDDAGLPSFGQTGETGQSTLPPMWSGSASVLTTHWMGLSEASAARRPLWAPWLRCRYSPPGFRRRPPGRAMLPPALTSM